MPGQDHTIPIESLLRHREWVRGVARALVFGDQDSEDLQQETWLAALKAPLHEETSPRGWLGTVLRRTASRLGRRDLKRRERERLARESVAPSTADVVARAELQERVVSRVLGLPEPYRETLLLRFYEDLPLRDIARRVHAPLETVRSRLRRGLTMLRSEFQVKEAGAWPLALLPLASMSSAKTGGSIAAGVLLMSKTKIATLLALAVTLSCFAWLVVTDRLSFGPSASSTPAVGDRPPVELPERESLSTMQPVRPIVPRPFIEPAESAESQRVGASRPAVTAGRARLEIPVFEADGRPASSRVFDLVTTMGVKTADELAQEEWGIAMTFGWSSGQMGGNATYAQSSPNADGVATCDIPADQPGHLRVREAPVGPMVLGPRRLDWLAVIPFSGVPSGGTQRLEALRLTPIPLLVSGRVETMDGHAVAGANVRVAVSESGGSSKPELIRAIDAAGGRSAADGTFRIESAVTATGLLAWAHFQGGLASAITHFEQGQTDLVLKVQATGGLKGRIRLAPHLGEGKPGLDMRPSGPGLTFSAFRGGQWSPRPSLDVKKTGDLFREGIPAGTYSLFISVSITRVKTIENIVIEPGTINEDPRIADLIVGEGLREGVLRVVDGGGKPVARATVYWRGADRGGAIGGPYTSHTNEKGESTLPLPEDAVIAISVEAPGFRPWEGTRVTLPVVAKLDSGARGTISLPGSRDWATPTGIAEYLLCLLPESEVASARQEGKNPIPSKIHQSQCQTIHQRTEDYAFVGAPTGSMIVFVIPRKKHTGRTIMAGEYWTLYGEEGLEIGRLTLEQGKPTDAVVYRVEPDKLINLGLK